MSRTAENSKIKMLYFKNERRYRAGNLQKAIFLCHLTPVDDKNSTGLASLAFRILGRHMQTSN